MEPEMISAGVGLERQERVAILVLDRPDRQNAFNDRMWQRMHRRIWASRK